MNVKIKLIIEKNFISFFIICSMCLIYSCSNSIDEIQNRLDTTTCKLKSSSKLEANEFRVLNKIFKNTKGLPVWEAQLEKIIETDSIFKANQLELIGYTYVEEIKNLNELEKIKNEIVRNKAYFVKYDNSTSFSIEKNKMSEMVDTKKILDILIVESANEKALLMAENNVSEAPDYIHIFNKNDLGVVNLEWKYKGEVFSTSCIVSNTEGLIYDDILFNINFVVQTSDRVSTYNRPRLKNAAEAGNFIFNYWTLTDEDYNFMGVKLWEVNFYELVYGYIDGNIKRIENTDVTCDAWHNMFYYCVANTHVDLTQGVNGKAIIDHGYSWGASPITITYNGIGLGFSGSGNCVSGTRSVFPNDLHL